MFYGLSKEFTLCRQDAMRIAHIVILEQARQLEIQEEEEKQKQLQVQEEKQLQEELPEELPEELTEVLTEELPEELNLEEDDNVKITEKDLFDITDLKSWSLCNRVTDPNYKPTTQNAGIWKQSRV